MIDFCIHDYHLVGSSVMFVTTSSGDNLLFKRLTWPLNDRLLLHTLSAFLTF